MKIDPHGPLGLILTFLSVATLVCLAIGSIVAVIYGAFVLKSVLMMACLLMAAVGLPIVWLEKTKR